MRGTQLIFEKEDIKELKELYRKNAHNPDAVFLFQGAEVLTGYAKYLIEHIENLEEAAQ